MKSKMVMLEGASLPQQLRDIPSAPKRLYTSGNLAQALEAPLLAVVGSRKVSQYGREVTGQLVREVAMKGVGIVSGLALGVDGVAHDAALEVHAPTIAVMPCGLDKIYPQTHTQLAQRILNQGGALISEYPAGTPPLRQNFIARNRLVSGLANAVLITEAAQKSGTLHTANFALEQGKTVMAVPGNITNFQSQGTNNLIKAGAIPVTSAEDILLALDITTENREQIEIFGDTPEETVIIKLLQNKVHDVHELQKQSGLTAREFNQSITMLELNGKITSLGGGSWSLTV